MSEFRPVEGDFNVGEARFAIIVARWNGNITENLLNGALRALARHNVTDESIDVIRVPGAFELPATAMKLAEQGNVDAVITLGFLARGANPCVE